LCPFGEFDLSFRGIDGQPGRARSDERIGVMASRQGTSPGGQGVTDWTTRAQRVNEKDRDLRLRFELRDRDDQSRRDWERDAEDFKAELDSLYAPITAALSRVRGGERTAIDQVLDFLEADPWCFRSGYMKSKLMHAIANGPELQGESRRRAQRVVIRRLLAPQPGLQRHARRLAAAVWDDTLRNKVLDLAAQPAGRTRAEAECLLAAVAHQLRCQVKE
jgi:hypothetical protein